MRDLEDVEEHPAVVAVVLGFLHGVFQNVVDHVLGHDNGAVTIGDDQVAGFTCVPPISTDAFGPPNSTRP